MDAGLILTIVGIVVLLAGSAFFSSSETALTGSSVPKLHAMEHEGDSRAARVLKLLERPDILLGSILLGNNVVNIGASALATGLFIQLFGDIGVLYATIVMTVLVLIFAEVLPKTAASRMPEPVAMTVSIPILALIWVLRPATWLLSKICTFLLRLGGMRDDSNGSQFSTHDVRGAIGMGKAHGVLERGDHRMLDSILDLDDLTVEDLMTHRSQIMSLNVTSTPLDIAEFLRTCPYTRVPVWEEDNDNIIGILHARDFFHAFQAAQTAKTLLEIKDILSPAYFVPETTSVKKQLMEFRKRRRHLAMVVDEYGDLQGLITLEDVLEEIVGEIEDEHDIAAQGIQKMSNGSVILPGDFAVRDANRELDIDLPEDEDAVTIGGLITETLGHIPAVGESVTFDDWELKVLARKRQAIAKVELSKIHPHPTAGDDE